jgi:hypothetical protein
MTHIQRFHDNLAFASRCSTTEHRNESLLVDRRRRRHFGDRARGLTTDHLRNRNPPDREAAMKCILIAYLSAGGGAAFGYAIARLLRVGGRS